VISTTSSSSEAGDGLLWVSRRELPDCEPCIQAPLGSIVTWSIDLDVDCRISCTYL